MQNGTLSFWRRTRLAMALLFWSTLGTGASATLLFAYDYTNGGLISFDAATPGTLMKVVTITGLLPGEFLIGMDFRPRTGELFAVTSADGLSRVVTINVLTGAVTAVSSATFALPSTAHYGVAINPVVDRIRITSSLQTNVRANPINGLLAAVDANLAYAAGDVNAGVTPTVTHVAYTSNYLGTTTTTLYGIDAATDSLVRIGGPDGTPSPNLGVLTTIGPLGVNATNPGGFTIAWPNDVAFAVLRVAGVSALHSINLATGAATQIGVVGNSGSIDGLAASLAHECIDIDGNGVVTPLTDGLMLLRAMLGMTSAVPAGALQVPPPPRSTWPAIRNHLNTRCGMHFNP